MKMQKRLAKAIRKFGQAGDDDMALAEYLIGKGWRDTEKRPRPQQVRVVPSLQQVTQTPIIKVRDMRSMPVDSEKTRYLRD